jgi:uncharacterized protein YgbK (DUF1537 family)
VDAIVIALKSRTSEAGEAVEHSLGALRWLENAGCLQFFSKYCSTFDSTPRGNIGPIADALLQALGANFTIACPAFPANGRTVYQGHLFLGNTLLAESGMRYHPLTPMSDSNLVRLLQQQTRGKVGLVDYRTVSKGPAAIRKSLAALEKEDYRFAVVDALSDADLEAIGTACADLPLVTGGSGVARGLPENFRRRGLLNLNGAADALPATDGLRAVISGSCSIATQQQVAAMQGEYPSLYIDPLRLEPGVDIVDEALRWAASRIGQGPVLIYSTAGPDTIRKIQEQVGGEKAGSMVEDALARIAKGLVRCGVRQMIVAGGETSGAVAKALGVSSLRIGPEIDPGVPWTTAVTDDAEGSPIALAFKSGNFGSADFFLKAWSRLV